MMKKQIVTGIIIGALIAPIAASALTVDEIQAQIKELLAKVAALQVQLKATQDATASSSVSAVHPSQPLKHRVCLLLDRNLAPGSRGDEVRGLQEFLREEGHLKAEVSGYFGAMTKAALANWQATQGVSAIGSFGPLSRERIKLWCGGGWQNTKRFDASPNRGDAPLTVVFSTWLSGFRPASIYYTIDFGDGTSERAADCYAPADACQSPGQNKHTYASNGTYTATLNKITDPCPDDGNPNTPRCLAPIQSEVVAKQKIFVGPIACTEEYMPVCGAKPIVCITTPCNPIPTTYGNKCMMEADGAKFLYSGTCRDNTTDPANDPQCKSWYDGCNSCGRSEPGGAAFCTLRACSPETMSKPYCTGYFNDSGNRAPVISGFAGPVSLAVNEQGIWKITASDPENGTLSYSILWGDEWTDYDASVRATAPQASIQQDTTFTHSYARPGSYKIKLTVTDNAGKTAQSTATVQVSQTVCTAQYDPVCGRPRGCANTCPPGMYCTMICQLHQPQTYGNRCTLNNANADFLHAGACTGNEPAY